MSEQNTLFPFHVEGCICPRFRDIAPSLIADLTCPVHGIDGSDPGDKLAPDGPHEWRPLGFRRTLRFFFKGGGGRFASWRYFGLELCVEISNGTRSVWVQRTPRSAP